MGKYLYKPSEAFADKLDDIKKIDPKDASACNRPQSGQRPVDRHKEFPSLWKHCSWGCSIICKNMVPFHDLWTDGGETEKRPPCPPRVTEPAQTYGSYFWDTTL
jgi:hypothetical protein